MADALLMSNSQFSYHSFFPYTLCAEDFSEMARSISFFFFRADVLLFVVYTAG